MVIYTKETKTLIIPEGLGNLQSGNCDGVYREGFDDGYSSGYTSGHTDGYQEGLAADCGEAIETAYDNGYGDGYTSGTTDGYNEGYGDGYAQGQEDCSGSSCELMIGTVDLENGDSGQWVRYPDEGYDGFRQVRIYDRGYGQGKYDQGYQDGLANCPECPTVDCTSAVTEAYQSGYTAGLNDCSGSTDCSSAITAAYNEGYADGEQEGAEAGYNNGYREGYEDGIEDCGAYSACPIQVYKEISLQDTEIDIYPDQGYVGVGQLHIDAAQYGNSKYGEGYEDGTTDGFNSGYTSGATDGYASGYTAGLADCSGDTPCDCTEAYQEGYTSGNTDGYASGRQSGYTDGYGAGFGDGYSAGQADCPECDCESAVTEAFQSGYTEGFDEGFMSGASTTDCSSAVTEAYEIGFQSGYTAGLQSGRTNNLNFVINITNWQGPHNEIREITLNGEPYNCTTDTDEWGTIKIYGETTESAITSLSFEVYTVYLEIQSAVTINGTVFSAESVTVESLDESLFVTWYRCTIDFDDIPMYEIESSAVTSAYQSGYADGFASGQSSCDCTSAITEAYQSGYTAGFESCSGDTCNLQYKEITVDATNYGGAYTIFPDSGYQGFYAVDLNAAQWTEDMYNSGSTDGFIAGYASGSTDTWPIAYQSGYTDGLANCPGCDCTSAFTEGYTSGYTDGRAATGTDRTYALEVTFSTQNSYFASVSGANIKVTTLVHPDDYLSGTAKPSFFEYTYLNEDYDYQNNIATYQFVGQWRYGNPSGQVQGNVTPTCLFIDVLKSNTNNWGDFYCTKVRFNPNVTIENGVAVFENETGFEYIPVETYNNHIDDTDPRFEQVQIDWNQQVLCNNCTEAYEEGQGSVGTLEFTFEGNLPSVGWFDEPVITAEMYSGNTYVGQYRFNYSGNGFDMTAENAYPGTEDVKSFAGYFEGQGLPDPTYLDIRSIGIDVYTSYLNSWSNWDLTIRVNGRPRYRRSAGQIIEFRGVTTGGFKLTPSSIDTSSTGYTPNTTHVVATL